MLLAIHDLPNQCADDGLTDAADPGKGAPTGQKETEQQQAQDGMGAVLQKASLLFDETRIVGK